MAVRSGLNTLEDVAQAVRQLDIVLSRLEVQKQDFHQRRITNAARSVDSHDYIVQEELTEQSDALEATRKKVQAQIDDINRRIKVLSTETGDNTTILNVTNLVNNQTIVYNGGTNQLNGVTGLGTVMFVVQGITVVNTPVQYLDWASAPQTVNVPAVSVAVGDGITLTFTNGVLTAAVVT